MPMPMPMSMISSYFVPIFFVLLSLHGISGRPFDGHRPFFPVPEHVVLDSASSAGQPLKISSKNVHDEQLREKTRVTGIPGMPDDPFSYSGYLNVDENLDSNLFYWFFEAQNGNKDAPVLLWLQGGPGGTSMFGLFSENGPFYLTDDLKLVPRNVTWNLPFAMLYIDNPVGVGFSYTGSDAGYSRNETQVASNLYQALLLFFQVYKDYADNDFYVTGESYAGKYIPALAYYINSQPKRSINLKGMAIGDGLSDPFTQIQAYADMAYNFGLADESQRKVMINFQTEILGNILEENWSAASAAFMELIDGPPDYFQNITGSENYYDIRTTFEPSYGGDLDAFLNQTSIRRALHVGNHYFDMNSDYAGFLLTDDLCKSVADMVTALLPHIKCLFYNGQFDFIVGPATTELFLSQANWPGLSGYLNATRVIWRLPSSSEVAGWARSYGLLTQVIVHGAGHILPFDQPQRAFDMIYRFVENIPFDK